jgi:DnaJ-class molecular chaperone
MVITEMESKVFNPEKIGMRICPHCNSYGRKYGSVCSRCGGFGYIKKDGRKFLVSPSISKNPLTHPLPPFDGGGGE